MKTKYYSSIVTAVLVLFSIGSAWSQTTVSSSQNLDVAIAHKIEKNSIKGVAIGTLMCENENGEMIICSGNEFEKILGFATNIPYVTVNKPQNPNDKKDEFSGFASLAAGKISKGNYVAAGKNGTVVRCEKTDYPYAVALEDAVSEGQHINVKILGNRK